MTSKDKTVKIKAKYDCEGGSYKKYDVFQALLKKGFYYFMDNDGHDRYRPEEEFTIIPDEPAIEVGSEWVDGVGNMHTVKFSSKNTVVYGEGDWCADPKDFLTMVKPKTKTVTMYFYNSSGSIVAYDTDNFAWGAPLFTREIELP